MTIPKHWLCPYCQKRRIWGIQRYHGAMLDLERVTLILPVCELCCKLPAHDVIEGVHGRLTKSPDGKTCYHVFDTKLGERLILPEDLAAPDDLQWISRFDAILDRMDDPEYMAPFEVIIHDPT